jgi:uncharacterized protein (DUF427 family)
VNDAEVNAAWERRPDYRVELLTRTNVMTAWLGGTVLARSGACLVVDEQDHGLVVYFPPDAVDFTLLEPVDLRTVCPFKGQAVYWRAVGSDAADWVAWSYPEPFPQVARLAGYVAFDQDAAVVALGKGVYTGVRS